MIIRNLHIVFLVVILAGCECEIEESTHTSVKNNLDLEIYIEFRYFDGENNDGSLRYIYQYQNIHPNYSTGFKIKSETKKKHGLACIGDSNRLVETNIAPVQFSLGTLAQYTICDAVGFRNEYGGEVPRYQINSLGTNCGDYLIIDISEGY